jgi:hypothetical protein
MGEPSPKSPSRESHLSNPSPFKGEVRRGMGLRLLDCQPNFLLYRLYLLKNFIVPESENAKTSRL